MDEQVQKDTAEEVVALNKLFTQYFPTASSNNLAFAQVQKPEEHFMRWIFLGIIAIWIISGLSGSIALFLLTRSNLSFVPLTATIGFAPTFLNIIVRFLFWRSEDYRLEELKQVLKVRRLELKYQVRQA